jgi:hypothetical protein
VRIALSVHLGLEVLAPISFDDQPRLKTDEVNNVVVDWLLPAESPSGELPITQ